MKDYMANGRFPGALRLSRMRVWRMGNIDDSIDQLVKSPDHDLFKPLPDAFDLAMLHHVYLRTGWEVPQASSAH